MVFFSADRLHKKADCNQGWKITCYWSFYGRNLAVCNGFKVWYASSTCPFSCLSFLKLGKQYFYLAMGDFTCSTSSVARKAEL
jgi:hypothetical protein